MSSAQINVWVLQESGNDYSSAEEYGEVQFVTHTDITKIKGSQRNLQVGQDVRRFLSEYILGSDYIIPAGNPMLVCMVLMSLPTGTHQFLKWDGRRSLYIPYHISPVK